MTSPKPKKRLDWRAIWAEFRDWHQDEQEKARSRRCKSCDSVPYCAADDWENQQRAIQRIVEAHR
jgi:hypothetical protein